MTGRLEMHASHHRHMLQGKVEDMTDLTVIDTRYDDRDKHNSHTCPLTGCYGIQLCLKKFPSPQLPVCLLTQPVKLQKYTVKASISQVFR